MGGKQVTLKGDPNLCKALVSLKTMVKEIQGGDDGFLVELSSLRLQEALVEEIPQEVQAMLSGFRDVFQASNGLSPTREHDHSILLKEKLEPVNVGPYRYPHMQKNVIEHLVSEKCWKLGLYDRVSVPFRARYSFVKKKDRS